MVEPKPGLAGLLSFIRIYPYRDSEARFRRQGAYPRISNLSPPTGSQATSSPIGADNRWLCSPSRACQGQVSMARITDATEPVCFQKCQPKRLWTPNSFNPHTAHDQSAYPPAKTTVSKIGTTIKHIPKNPVTLSGSSALATSRR